MMSTDKADSANRHPVARRRGRETFARVRRLISLVEAGASILPVRVRSSALIAIRTCDSRVSRLLRYALLRSLAESCGEIVDIRSNVYLFALERLKIGSRVSIHPLCYLDATGGLTIGDDVSIAHGVSVLTTEHRWTDVTLPIRDQGVSEEPVIIGSNVWIGAGARILGGVTLGSGSIIAAGAVVTRSVEPMTVVGGIPAVVLKRR